MAVTNEQAELSPATYADLFALEQDFEAIDAIATAYQESLSQPFHKKRAELAARIPGFWPLVFEQAPPDVDQYIQPSDSAVLATCLTGFSVTRFEGKGGAQQFAAALKSKDEVDESPFGEVRSVVFRFEFKENEWFEDKVIEKKFWYRRCLEGTGEDAPIWDGRISEPVRIHWKNGKDLSEGLTDAACALWAAQKRAGLLNAKDYEEAKKNDDASKKLPEHISLTEKMENNTEGSQSFFTWFGYHGPWVSPAQDAAARKVEKERRIKPPQDTDGAAEEDDGEEEDLDEMPAHLAVEIFPDGEELALALAEDVWPNAIKYFLEAQEDDDDEDEDEEMDDGSFDEADLDEMDEDSDEGQEQAKAGQKEIQPAKKRRT